MTAPQATQTNDEQNPLGSAVAQHVAQRPLLMVGAAAIAGFVFGQFERSRSARTASRVEKKAGSPVGFVSSAMEAAASSGSRPMSLQDFANRYTGS